MPIMRSILLLCLGAMLIACGQSSLNSEQQALNRLGQTISGWHSHFANSTASLRSQAEQFCTQPDASSQAVVQQHWLAAMNDWQAVHVINFGPVTIDNQHWKIQFWPDNHNLVGKKARQLLASDDSIDLARIEKASVVIQGLSGLEYLLFDQESQLDQFINEPRRCDMLVAVAAHTEQVAKKLHDAWRPAGGNYLQVFTQPGEANPEFKDSNAALAAVIEAMIASADTIKWKKIAAPLGLRELPSETPRPRPFLSEAWRSQTSLTLMSANIDALETLFNDQKAYLASQQDGQNIAEQISTQFTEMKAQLAAVKPPLIEAVKQPDGQQSLKALNQATGQLLGLLKNPLPKALNITLGFNSNDGD